MKTFRLIHLTALLIFSFCFQVSDASAKPAAKTADPSSAASKGETEAKSVSAASSTTQSAATATSPAACFPACRQGYVCSAKGECVSLCNPPCGAGEACTAEGACVRVASSKALSAADAGEPEHTTQASASTGSSSATGAPLSSVPYDHRFELRGGLGYLMATNSAFHPNLSFTFTPMPEGKFQLWFGLKTGVALFKNNTMVTADPLLEIRYRGGLGNTFRPGFHARINPAFAFGDVNYNQSFALGIGAGTGPVFEIDQLVIKPEIGVTWYAPLAEKIFFGTLNLEAGIRF